ncbi:hypothetical protein [Komagataeibacter sp. SM21]|uniref:hypothetical protein n=1 Tax=Komagataeibacter sp. SM21 TaxID=3242899 RepID=UPI00352746C0
MVTTTAGVSSPTITACPLLADTARTTNIIAGGKIHFGTSRTKVRHTFGQPSTTGKDTISHAYSHAAAVSPGGTTYGVMILRFEKDIMTGMAFSQVSTD